MFKTLNNALMLGTTLAAPTAWNGIWNDPVYGGQIKVCVSEVSSVWYGQATISDTAYMRGTIDATTDVWTGNFYVQGIEAQRGTFSLTMTTGTPNTYAASWTQLPGIFTYNSAGSQSDTNEPSKIDCFKTDDDYVSLAKTHSFTGTLGFGANHKTALDDGNMRRASYVYTWGEGNIADGYQLGPIYENNQVVPSQWYESGGTEGMELLVAKNATAFYYLWWWAARMSDFDITKGTTSNSGRSVNNQVSTSYDGYDEWNCMIHSTTSAETTCLQLTTTCDEDDETEVTGTVSMAFTILNTILLLVLVLAALVSKSASAQAPMASSSEGGKL